MQWAYSLDTLSPQNESFRQGRDVSELSPLSIPQLKEKCRVLRKLMIEMTTTAGSGHPSSGMSACEILAGLYFGGIMRHDPANPHWPDRDRFILSKGHGCPGLYAVLAEAGYFPHDWLSHLRQIGQPLEGHPNMKRCPGAEASTGSLGQGLSIGIGHALAGRLDGKGYHVFVMTGDGECDQGQIWEAAMSAAYHQVGSITWIVDHNHRQQTGEMVDVLDIRPLASKIKSFGWDVREIDGHDLEQVMDALRWSQQQSSQPKSIVADTIKGKGVSFVEADFSWHGRALSKDEMAKALIELGF